MSYETRLLWTHLPTPILYFHPRQISRPPPSSITPILVAVDGHPPITKAKELNKPQRWTYIGNLSGDGIQDVVAGSNVVPKHCQKASQVCEVLHVSEKLVFILKDVIQAIGHPTVVFLAWRQSLNPARSLRKIRQRRPTGKR
jgi:hypothetical protein